MSLPKPGQPISLSALDIPAEMPQVLKDDLTALTATARGIALTELVGHPEKWNIPAAALMIGRGQKRPRVEKTVKPDRVKATRIRRELPCVSESLEVVKEACPKPDAWRDWHNCENPQSGFTLVKRGYQCELCDLYVARGGES